MSQVKAHTRKGQRVKPHKRNGWSIYTSDRRTPILVDGNLSKKAAVKKALSIKKRGSDNVDTVRRLTDSEQKIADKGKWVRSGRKGEKPGYEGMRGQGPAPKSYRAKNMNYSFEPYSTETINFADSDSSSGPKKNARVGGFLRNGIRVKPHTRRVSKSKKDEEGKESKGIDTKKLVAAGLVAGGVVGAAYATRSLRRDRKTLAKLTDYKSKAANARVLTKPERRDLVRRNILPEDIKKNYDSMEPGSLIRMLSPKGNHHYGVTFKTADGKQMVAHMDLVNDAGVSLITEEPIEKYLKLGASMWEKVDAPTKLSSEEINRRAIRALGAKIPYSEVNSNCESFARMIVQGKGNPRIETSELSSLTKVVVNLRNTFENRKAPKEIRDSKRGLAKIRELNKILDSKLPKRQKEKAQKKLKEFQENIDDFSGFSRFLSFSKEKITKEELDSLVYKEGNIVEPKEFSEAFSVFMKSKRPELSDLYKYAAIKHYLISLTLEFNANFSSSREAINFTVEHHGETFAGVNKPKRTPGHKTKSHAVLVNAGKGKKKIVRFGQQGVSGSPKKEGESEASANRRKRFKSRHQKNIKKGKTSAAFWSDKVKWSKYTSDAFTFSEYANPELRERIKNKIKASDKGGASGQWSARKSQLLAKEYKAKGGGYKGSKDKAAKSLNKWTDEKWRYSDGKESGGKGRYRPAKVWQKLSDKEKESLNQSKYKANKEGKQVSKIPKKIRDKVQPAKV